MVKIKITYPRRHRTRLLDAVMEALLFGNRSMSTVCQRLNKLVQQIPTTGDNASC